MGSKSLAQVALPLLLCIAALPAGNAQNATAPSPPPLAPQDICVADDGVVVKCLPDPLSGPLDPASYSGYEVVMLRKAASYVGWVEGVDYQFRCMTFDDMLADLQAPNGTCLAGAGGITVTPQRRKFLQFTWPSLRSSLAAMVYAKPGSSSDGWYFLDAFATDVWLALLGTALVVPVVAFLLEYLSVQGSFKRSDVYPGMKEATWRSFWTITEFEPFMVTSTAARIMAVAYGFMALVVVELFQAEITASLTVRNVRLPATSPEGLVGKATTTLDVYDEQLVRTYGLQPAVWPKFEGRKTVEEWAALLRAGVVTAVIEDSPFLENFASQAPGCDLAILPAAAVPIDYAPGFRLGTDPALVERWSQALLVLQEDGTLSDLATAFVSVPNPACSAQLASVASISFKDIYGAWVILAGALGVAVLLLGWKKGRRAWHARSGAAAAKEKAAALPPLHVVDDGDGDEEDDEGDDNVSDNAELNITILRGAAPPRAANYRAGVAFRQRVSMFGMQLARNRPYLRALEHAENAPAGGAAGIEDAVAVAAKEDDPVTRLRKLTSAFEQSGSGGRSLPSTSGRKAGATYTVDDMADEAPMADPSAIERRYSTVDDSVDEARPERPLAQSLTQSRR